MSLLPLTTEPTLPATESTAVNFLTSLFVSDTGAASDTLLPAEALAVPPEPGLQGPVVEFQQLLDQLASKSLTASPIDTAPLPPTQDGRAADSESLIETFVDPGVVTDSLTAFGPDAAIAESAAVASGIEQFVAIVTNRFVPHDVVGQSSGFDNPGATDSVPASAVDVTSTSTSLSVSSGSESVLTIHVRPEGTPAWESALPSQPAHEIADTPGTGTIRGERETAESSLISVPGDAGESAESTGKPLANDAPQQPQVDPVISAAGQSVERSVVGSDAPFTNDPRPPANEPGFQAEARRLDANDRREAAVVVTSEAIDVDKAGQRPDLSQNSLSRRGDQNTEIDRPAVTTGRSARPEEATASNGAAIEDSQAVTTQTPWLGRVTPRRQRLAVLSHYQVHAEHQRPGSIRPDSVAGNAQLQPVASAAPPDRQVDRTIASSPAATASSELPAQPRPILVWKPIPKPAAWHPAAPTPPAETAIVPSDSAIAPSSGLTLESTAVNQAATGHTLSEIKPQSAVDVALSPLEITPTVSAGSTATRTGGPGAVPSPIAFDADGFVIVEAVAAPKPVSNSSSSETVPAPAVTIPARTTISVAPEQHSIDLTTAPSPVQTPTSAGSALHRVGGNLPEGSGVSDTGASTATDAVPATTSPLGAPKESGIESTVFTSDSPTAAGRTAASEVLPVAESVVDLPTSRPATDVTIGAAVTTSEAVRQQPETSVPTGPALPDGPDSVPQQLHDAIRTRAQATAPDEESRLQVALDPPELGRVLVDVSRSDDGIRARLVAVDASARAVLEAELGQLRQTLGNAGIELLDLEVAQHDAGENQRDLDRDAQNETDNARDGHRSTGETSDRRQTESPQVEGSPRRESGRLDVVV